MSLPVLEDWFPFRLRDDLRAGVVTRLSNVRHDSTRIYAVHAKERAFTTITRASQRAVAIGQDGH
jgi:hypothetical protein